MLVVDDDPQNALVASAVLRAMGCGVEVAPDGETCLARVPAYLPDLILLDVLMPGLDGVAVCRALKSKPETRAIPVVLLTGLTAMGDRVKGIEAGASDFISKPFDPHEFRARVKNLLHMKRLEEGERDRLRRTLERYVDVSVVEQALQSGEMARPGARRTEASVLFADIRGFTAWTETLPPETIVEVLNLFLVRAVESVFSAGGMVDKFLGDGLMAVFGVPVAQPDHADRAVRCALDVVRVARGLRHPALRKPLSLGCAVNSGVMVVGNIGSERRMDFTAIGDAVNVASRLCGAAKGGQVLVSEETHSRLAGAFRARPVGALRLRNRSAPVKTYSIAPSRARTAASAPRGGRRGRG